MPVAGKPGTASASNFADLKVYAVMSEADEVMTNAYEDVSAFIQSINAAGGRTKYDQIPSSEGWTHAAKVLDRNVYHSKIGGSFDIKHSGGEVFAGSTYGTIYQFMRRKQTDRSICEDIRKQVPGFSIPDDILNIIQAMMA